MTTRREIGRLLTLFAVLGAGAVLAACGASSEEDLLGAIQGVSNEGPVPDMTPFELMNFENRMSLMRELDADIQRILDKVDTLQDTMLTASDEVQTHNEELIEEVSSLQGHQAEVQELIDDPDRLRSMTTEEIKALVGKIRDDQLDITNIARILR